MALEQALAITIETLKSAAPILLATLGAIIGQRAGVLNLGLEGAVYLSAAVAVAVGMPWGFLAAVAAGAAFNLVYYVLANEMALNQILLGFAFTMVGYGLGSQIAYGMVGRVVERAVVHGYETFAAAAALALALRWLFGTRLGAAIKASGDDPVSLDLMGVDVYRVRRAAGAMEGALASAAGAYLSLIYYGTWSEPLMMGWGLIAIIMAMVSLWSPLLAVGTSLVPSLFISLAYALQGYLGVSPHLLSAVPYAVCIAVLTAAQLAVMKSRLKAFVPRWLARPYVREERA
ncbi:MAG: ABC transporter permease [Thermoproteaceae archaeon]|jgi:simple sugar transport system permease protein|nr:ABC transporter permease [Thermoproteaceae archaeon]